MFMPLIYDHNGHICLQVWIVVKLCCHERIFIPPMHDILAMAVHSAMEGLPRFTHILLATTPACNKINHTGGLPGGPYHYFQLLFSCLAGESIRGQQYGTGFIPSHPAQLVAGLLIRQ